jgi:hypothetical protein
VVEATQTEARALGDPTRHRIFRYMADAQRPVGVAELTEFVRLNHNAVRHIPGSADSVDLLEEEMIRRGFRPLRSERGRRVNFVLGRCPFAEVASEDPETVFQLHLGLAEGLADGLGGLEVERLVVKETKQGGCPLVVQRWQQDERSRPVPCSLHEPAT